MILGIRSSVFVDYDNKDRINSYNYKNKYLLYNPIISRRKGVSLEPCNKNLVFYTDGKLKADLLSDFIFSKKYTEK